MLSTLRQQGGAAVLTVPTAILTQLGWQIGNKINLERQGDSVVLQAVKRQPRGRKSVDELLAGIDSQEIAELNQSIAGLDEPKGREVW